ncbi:EutP/PduV family microcompartment system protein [Companilactobacillus ginsenosidimutans]|uniref:Ethanolamine utilization protein EutP n=1 Tax=Companilactobacillus ginsenosidimutans TaxID=1007676 RepID=A0A0H4QGR6_9LACO|nr:EutP/PduV family microcompartment system protein [Companilactobacillus ginsenosidimutans]AKP66201.1 ethanolamine utilization protein EutP [Companilactobacillus ginsenosidimutans]
MKKAFLVGAVGCGKTTFKQVMMNEKRSYDKTQAIEYFNNLIDSPGEFTEHRRMYSALNVTANASDVVVMMQSVIDHRQVFSPGFAQMFLKPSIGVVTKIDLAEKDSDIEFAKNQLILAGAHKIFYISNVEDPSPENEIQALIDYLKEDVVKK